MRPNKFPPGSFERRIPDLLEKKWATLQGVAAVPPSTCFVDLVVWAAPTAGAPLKVRGAGGTEKKGGRLFLPRRIRLGPDT